MSASRGYHGGLLHLLAFALVILQVAAEPCQQHPKDFTIVQFTNEDCRCCFDLDEFIQDHDYVYVLFYSIKGRLNIDINAKFEQMANDWKWSRIHFGRIDTDKDKEMSKKWVEPGMVPTNVMYKFGRPVEVQPKDFEQIRDRYQGSPDGQKWMVTKYMGEDSHGTNLHYISSLLTVKRLSKFVKGHEISIIGFFQRDGDLQHRVFSEAVWKLHQEIDRDDIGAGLGAVTAQSPAKKTQAAVPSIVVYLDGKVVEEDGTFAPEKWQPKPIMEFMRQFLPLDSQDAANLAGEKADGKQEL
jgi:hypothetical protein